MKILIAKARRQGEDRPVYVVCKVDSSGDATVINEADFRTTALLAARRGAMLVDYKGAKQIDVSNWKTLRVSGYEIIEILPDGWEVINPHFHKLSYEQGS